jgi:hypothetical protein
MTIFILVFLSATVGLGVGIYYKFGPTLMKRIEVHLERIKPKTPDSFILYQLAVLLLGIPVFVLPFAFVLWLPMYVARFFGVNDVAVLMGAWAISFFALWAGYRFVKFEGDNSSKS